MPERTSFADSVPAPWSQPMPAQPIPEEEGTSLDAMIAQSESAGDIDATLPSLEDMAAGSESAQVVNRTALEKINRVLGQVASPIYETINEAVFQIADFIETSESELVKRDYVRPRRNTFGEMGPAENDAEVMARGAGKGLEGLATFLLPATRAAKLKPPMGTPSTIPLKERVGEAIVDPLRTDPKRALALDAAASVVAGGAAELAQEKGGGPVAQGVAGLVGGLAPGAVYGAGRKAIEYAPSRMAYKAVKDLVSPRDAAIADAQAAGKTVRAAMTPEAEGNLRATQELQNRMGMRGRFSLAEATESPQLLAVQRDIEDTAAGSALDALVARRRIIESDLRRFGETAGPPRVDDDGVVIDVARQRLQAANQRGTLLQEQLAGQQRSVAETLPEPGGRYEAGGALRERIVAARRAKSAEMSRVAAEMGLNENQTTFDLRPLQQIVAAEFKRKSDFDLPPPDLARRIRDYGREEEAVGISPLERSMREQAAVDEPVPITFQALKDMRERVSDELIDAVAAANQDTRKIRDLTRLKMSIDDYVAKAEPIEGGNVAQSWKQFRQRYYDEFVRRFEEGAAYKVRTSAARDEYRVHNERVADAFLRGPTEIKQYKEIFGNEGELTAAMLDKARAAVVRDGVIDPKRLKSFIDSQTSNGVLQELPETRRLLGSTNDAAQALASREAQLVRRQALIERSMLAKIVGEPNVVPIVEQAIGSPAKMRELFRSLPAEAHPGLRRAIWEQAVTRLGPLEIENASTFANFLQKNRPALEVALSKQHVADLDTILQGARKLTMLDPPRGAAEYASPLQRMEKATGTGVGQASSRIFAAQSGRTSWRSTAIDWFARLVNVQSKNRTRALMSAAVYDEKIARAMASTVGQQQLAPEQAKKVRHFLFSLGYPLLENNDDQ